MIVHLDFKSKDSKQYEITPNIDCLTLIISQRTFLRCIRSLSDKVQEQKLKYCSSLLVYIRDIVNPILNCLYFHCNDDIDYFIKIFGEQPDYEQFGQKHCSEFAEQCPAKVMNGRL